MDSDRRLIAPAPASLSIYFAVAFGATWALQAPAALARLGLLRGAPESYLPFAALGMFGPLVAALISVRREQRLGHRSGPLGRELFGGLKLWRVAPVWYLLALAIPGLALLAVLALLRAAGHPGDVLLLPDSNRLLAALLISVVEEVGWRGYALPRLQSKYGAVAASGLLGVAWTFWHFPLFLAVGVPLSLLLVMLLYFVGGSLTFTWIFNRTGGSLLLAVLAHLGAHLQNSHLALPGDAVPLVAHAIIYAAIGVGAALLDQRFSPSSPDPQERPRLIWPTG